MFKAFLFDLDGTLQDTEVLYVEAWRRAYQEKGCSVSLNEAGAMVYGRAKSDVSGGVPCAVSPRLSHARKSGNAAATALSRLAGRAGRSHSRLDRTADPLGGALSRGDCFRQRKARRGRGDRVLGIGASAAFYLGCEDYSPGKPDPACFRLAAERLHVRPEECLVFEDSAAGVQAAKAAGMACIALRRPAPRNKIFPRPTRCWKIWRIFACDRWKGPCGCSQRSTWRSFWPPWPL